MYTMAKFSVELRRQAARDGVSQEGRTNVGEMAVSFAVQHLLFHKSGGVIAVLTTYTPGRGRCPAAAVARPRRQPRRGRDGGRSGGASGSAGGGWKKIGRFGVKFGCFRRSRNFRNFLMFFVVFRRFWLFFG